MKQSVHDCIQQLTEFQCSHNPLTIPILRILRSVSEPISEYTLIGYLNQSGDLSNSLGALDHLALFQTHFLVMNALYQLQDALLQDGYFLLISPLTIQLVACSQQAGTAMVEDQAGHALRDYYLDYRNLRDTDAEMVSQLLSGFWSRYVADSQQLEAYRVLGLEPGADWTQIQLAYRRCAAEQHPDRGGDAAQFMAIREAYETLRTLKAQ